MAENESFSSEDAGVACRPRSVTFVAESTDANRNGGESAEKEGNAPPCPGGDEVLDLSGTNSADAVDATVTSTPALKGGFRWQYQIVFRTKLTAHTAYERQDNPLPAPVTAIAVHPLVDAKVTRSLLDNPKTILLLI